MPGKILIFRAGARHDEVNQRIRALNEILRRMAEEDYKSNRHGSRHKDYHSKSSDSVETMKMDTIIFVPEGLVSMVIGTRGR